MRHRPGGFTAATTGPLAPRQPAAAAAAAASAAGDARRAPAAARLHAATCAAAATWPSAARPTLRRASAAAACALAAAAEVAAAPGIFQAAAVHPAAVAAAGVAHPAPRHVPAADEGALARGGRPDGSPRCCRRRPTGVCRASSTKAEQLPTCGGCRCPNCAALPRFADPVDACSASRLLSNWSTVTGTTHNLSHNLRPCLRQTGRPRRSSRALDGSVGELAAHKAG